MLDTTTLLATATAAANRSAAAAGDELSSADEQQATGELSADAAALQPPYCDNYAQNLTYLNVSCTTDLAYAMPLYGWATPLLVAVTVLSNTLIVIVLSRRHMQSPTNAVLMGKRTDARNQMHNVSITVELNCLPGAHSDGSVRHDDDGLSGAGALLHVHDGQSFPAAGARVRRSRLAGAVGGKHRVGSPLFHIIIAVQI